MPLIGIEGFRIEDRPGCGVKIIGNDDRGLLYGVGKLLRTSRYDRGGFNAGAWRGTSPDAAGVEKAVALPRHAAAEAGPGETAQRHGL